MFGTFSRHCGLSQIKVTPLKLNSSPLKNGGWKTILSSWGPVTFQGRLLLSFRGVKQLKRIYVSSFPEEVRWPFVRGLPPPVVENFSLPETTKGHTKNRFHVETWRFSKAFVFTKPSNLKKNTQIIVVTLFFGILKGSIPKGCNFFQTCQTLWVGKLVEFKGGWTTWLWDKIQA